jgi:hypothetical protein
MVKFGNLTLHKGLMDIKTVGKYLNKNLEKVVFVILAICLAFYLSYKTEAFIDRVKGINQMDGIVYINLENRSDRKELLLKELEKLDTDMSKVNKVSGVFIPKNGHKGCVQAHILALNLAKLNKWNMALIMEDDAELNTSPEDFNTIISKTLSELSRKGANWDVIMLATANKNYKDDKPITFTIDSVANIPESTNSSESPSSIEKTITIKKLKTATTSSAYIIKLQYYDKLLALFNEGNDNMKGTNLSGENYEYYALDQYWARLQTADNWYCFQDDIIKQRDIWSTIMKESHK